MVILTESNINSRRDDGWLRNYGVMGLILVVVLGMFYLPYRAGKNMFRGHVRNPFEIIVKTVLMNVILIAAGWCIALVLFVGIVPDPADGEITVQEAAVQSDIGRASARNVVLVCFGIGALVGLVIRRGFYRDLDNERFLSGQGFILVKDEREYPYQDGQGHDVKLLDPKDGKITVLYRYEPRCRGIIDLDSSGRMRSYSGPIDLQAQAGL